MKFSINIERVFDECNYLCVMGGQRPRDIVEQVLSELSHSPSVQQVLPFPTICWQPCHSPELVPSEDLLEARVTFPIMVSIYCHQI